MAFEDVMGTMMQWTTATAALAALGAELSLLQPGAEGSPEMVAALQKVSAAAGLTGLDELPPPQAAMVVSLIRTQLHHAVDLLDDPGKAPGWTYTDDAILDGLGRGSSMIPMLIASAHPDLAEVTSLLDVGTGVGFLAVAAANVWPAATVVGIDPWKVSLDRAAANVAQAGLDDRITLRQQELAAIDDSEAFDCEWIPTFFLTEDALVEGPPAALRALHPGGWAVLGLNKPAPTALGDAVNAVMWIRGGGSLLDADRATTLLTDAGFEGVHVASPPGHVPIALVLGQRPAG